MDLTGAVQHDSDFNPLNVNVAVQNNKVGDPDLPANSENSISPKTCSNCHHEEGTMKRNEEVKFTEVNERFCKQCDSCRESDRNSKKKRVSSAYIQACSTPIFMCWVVWGCCFIFDTNHFSEPRFAEQPI